MQHFLIPELSQDSKPSPDWTPLLERVQRGQAIVGAAKAVPVLVGPLTLVAIAKGDFDKSEMTQRLVPAYVEALQALLALGVPEVQVYPLELCSFACFYIHSLHCIHISLVHISVFRLEGWVWVLIILFCCLPAATASFVVLHYPLPLSAPAFPLSSRCCTHGSSRKDPWLIWKALLIILGEERGSNPRGHQSDDVSSHIVHCIVQP